MLPIYSCWSGLVCPRRELVSPAGGQRAEGVFRGGPRAADKGQGSGSPPTEGRDSETEALEPHPTSPGLHPRLGQLGTVSQKRVPRNILDQRNLKRTIYFLTKDFQLTRKITHAHTKKSKFERSWKKLYHLRMTLVSQFGETTFRPGLARASAATCRCLETRSQNARYRGRYCVPLFFFLHHD